MLQQYPSKLVSRMKIHLKLDVSCHSIVTIGLLLNAFAENYVAQIKASLRPSFNLLVNWCFKNFSDC